MKGAVEEAERDRRRRRRDAWIPGQFDNPANPRGALRDHRPRDRGGARRRRRSARSSRAWAPAAPSRAPAATSRSAFPGALAIAVEPAESPIITQTLAGEDAHARART